MRSASPVRERTPIRWLHDEDTIEGGSRNGELVPCIRAHRGLSGFEAIAIGEWCAEAIGTETIQWGRTARYGWWFADPARITQFLLVFQRSLPETNAQIRFLTDETSSVGSGVHWYPIKVGDRFV